LHAAEGSA